MDAPANIPPGGGRRKYRPASRKGGRRAYTTPQGRTPSVTRAPVTAGRAREAAQRRRSEREGSECDAREQRPVPL